MREHNYKSKTKSEAKFAFGIFLPRQSRVLAKYIRDGGIFIYRADTAA